MDTKAIGARTEGAVLAQLLKCGKTVLMPVGENQRYDLVVDDGERFVKIQCKTGRRSGGVIEFNACSTHHHRGSGARDYRGEVDYFGVACEGKVYLVPVADAGRYKGFMRLSPARNGQSSKIKLAQQYEMLP